MMALEDNTWLPMFVVWSPEEDQTQDDGERIRALDAQHAAELWADKAGRVSCEFLLLSGETITVCVFNEKTKEITRWQVSGEAIPHYNAREMSDV